MKRLFKVSDVVTILLPAVLFIDSVTCYGSYRLKIPNGEIVPHPCNVNWVWEGVGHMVRGGGGDRNQFGLDFVAANKIWTRSLCMKDSDDDGKTNGEELGDPSCVWIPGQQPTRMAGLSHPGFCNEENGDCSDKITVNCEQKVFECAAMTEPGVFQQTVRLSLSEIPAKETTYVSMLFDFPTDGDYHLTATTPYIDNVNVLHHIVMFGCDESVPIQHETNRPWESTGGGMAKEAACGHFVAIWGVGLGGSCMHKTCGIRVGSQGYKKGLIEVHWNNPLLEANTTDSSGMHIYLNANKRPYDAGIIMTGQTKLAIPPQEDRYTVTGQCDTGRCDTILSAPVQIVGLFNHMHYLGNSALTELIIPNERSTYLGYDQVYNYDRPDYHNIDNEIQMNPGDILQTTCNFKSTSRYKTTYKGKGTNSEMCYAFVMYYPKENFNIHRCTAEGEIGKCEWQKPIVRGCEIATSFDFTHPEAVARYETVTENCDFGYCRKECLRVVKEINAHHCYQGDMKYSLMKQSMSTEDVGLKYNITMFWSRLSSCDAHIAIENAPPCLNDETNTAAPRITLMTSYGVTSLLFLCTSFMSKQFA